MPTSTPSASPTKLPGKEEYFDLEKFRETADAEKLVDWVRSEHTKADTARSSKKNQWFMNMSMFFGNQYAQQMRGPGGDFLRVPKAPATKPRKTINLTRAFVRSEHAKFLASIPDAIAVPGSSEDEDLRAASAAEQVWESVSEARRLRASFKRASWWTIVTGVGFVKTWWDDSLIVNTDTMDHGDIRYGAVTPFHILVPDLTEPDIEDQPFVINAYTKTVEWCNYYYKEELKGVTLSPSASGASTLLEGAYLNLGTSSKKPDSVTVYEAWVKPGATPLLPDGGVVIIIDTVLVGMCREGLPYKHGMYPFTKFDHIDTETFYADSPLVDTNQLQREYNELRTDIAHAGKMTGRPQMAAQKGSIVPSKITNQAGLIIEYKPGSPPPAPIPIAPLPQYLLDQQDRVQSDWETITGQHEVSRGKAPAGITSGTAINYLQEKDDAFLSPQHQSIEAGYEKLALSTIGLFTQFVSLPRRIRTIGSDGAFDSVLLQGADLRNGTDIRIQKGSSIGQSKAAKDAKIMDMFAAGMIQDPNIALKLMEMGGADKFLDIMNVAETKAQRENLKMKKLDPMQLKQMKQQVEQEAMMMPPQAEVDPLTGMPGDSAPVEPQMQLIVPVADFDVHEVHIEVLNKFRMSQEYEMLDPIVQEQFELHTLEHKRYLMEAQMEQMSSMQPLEGEAPDPAPGDDTMSPTGAAPEAAPPMEGM